MEIDPHSLQEIVTKVRDQLRCPQCRKRVDVTFDAVKVLGDDFAVLQLKCSVCDTYIMLYASLNVERNAVSAPRIQKRTSSSASQKQSSGSKAQGSKEIMKNFSTKLLTDENDLRALRKSLEKAGGSFSDLFETEN